MRILNRKKRNLYHIRYKNKLREGIYLFSYDLKVTSNCCGEELHKYMIDTCKKNIKLLKNRYNLDINNFPKHTVKVHVGYNGDDIIKNIKTISSTINLVDYRFHPV